MFVSWTGNFYLCCIFAFISSDRWNILDLITLIIYFATFALRMVTLAVSESVTDNRSLVIAGYFYGINTMFLTLRAIGQVMETTKQIGPIQIALFHILSDLVTIFWQFIATILAFSIAITKVYVAEKSFISEDNGEELWVDHFLVKPVANPLLAFCAKYAAKACPTALFCHEYVDFGVDGPKIAGLTKVSSCFFPFPLMKFPLVHVETWEVRCRSRRTSAFINGLYLNI